jgi:hypothetical protein
MFLPLLLPPFPLLVVPLAGPQPPRAGCPPGRTISGISSFWILRPL